MTAPFKLTIKAMMALVFCTFLLAGCGQKGDLYLPEDASAPALTPQ
ncbi:lipoprotein [Endozoicomonas gorgoniicola]|uniref:Lipoprotein n=1 Tax=Endozoicomonas gorgoniicola TaxID=1234144 RepID=A0ABT3N269_9GAMM|nr:lipoprotein [Endozoicomonas gorgoniicola]MCW7555730.1 lipoprotein [Endozoicomonas gorgoniicola]